MIKYTIRQLADRLLGGRLLGLYKPLDGKQTDAIENRRITYKPRTDIGQELFFHGSFEKKELDICKRYIKEDSIILDIGANIGLHSIYFSHVAKNGVVIAFEPSQETFGMLLQNVKGLDNILPVNIALSNSTNITQLYIAVDNAYSSLKDTKRKYIKHLQKTISFKLDDLFLKLNLRKIDFIKIDVEGFEQQVLEGMSDTLNVFSPVIFCEIYKGTDSNENPEKTINFLLEKNYNAFVFDGKNLIPYKKHDDKMYNYLFLPKGEK